MNTIIVHNQEFTEIEFLAMVAGFEVKFYSTNMDLLTPEGVARQRSIMQKLRMARESVMKSKNDIEKK